MGRNDFVNGVQEGDGAVIGGVFDITFLEQKKDFALCPGVGDGVEGKVVTGVENVLLDVARGQRNAVKIAFVTASRFGRLGIAEFIGEVVRLEVGDLKGAKRTVLGCVGEEFIK